MVETDPRPLFPVVVTRHNWFRGQGGESSRLLTDTGKMCCLGHVALACGASKGDIYDKTSPRKLGDKLPERMRMLVTSTSSSGLWPSELWNSNICRDMMETNDGSHFTDADREAELITLGKKAGFALSFTDDIPSEEN